MCMDYDEITWCDNVDDCLERFCNETCQDTENVNKLERLLFIYLYPFIALLCVIGNTANLIVYNHHFLRSSTTIRMLAVKAVANTFNMFSLLPMHISSVVLLYPQLNHIPPPFYWYSLRYVLFFANVFSTIAIWLTAAVSIENCMLVVFPVHAKLWCTMRNATVSIAVCVAMAVALHSFNLFAFELSPVMCYDIIANNISHSYQFILHMEYLYVERMYYWCNAVTTTCAPMFIMAAATVLIYYHLVWTRSEISRGAEQKSCVVRLSFVTALCHVVFEMPHLGVLATAAMSGSARESTVGQWPSGAQILVTVSNFLTQINASIPFFVYFLCSKRFRQLCALTILGRSSADSSASTAFSRMSSNHRRSEVVLLPNHSRSTAGLVALSSFNDVSPRKNSRDRRTSSLINKHTNNETNQHSSSNGNDQNEKIVACSESTGLLGRGENQ